ATPTGAQIPLSLVSTLELTRGPPSIKTEDSRPNAWVYVDISTGDIGGFVRAAKARVAELVDIPAGYTLSWSGQYEYMARAAARLRLVVPVTLLSIFLLLYLHFRNLRGPLVVMLSIPFSLVGGIWLVYLYGFNLSVAVVVGFIALAGVAAEIGVLVLTFIDHEVVRLRGALAAPRPLTRAELTDAVYRGTAERLRPVVMTAVSTIAGLVPIMWGYGTGSAIMQRIAAPMVGGMGSALVLGLLVLPVVYGLVLCTRERAQNPA
ncbi:MAG: efflux RND transporter permease subunit, partial [Gammaproteobacteria bacterium]